MNLVTGAMTHVYKAYAPGNVWVAPSGRRLAFPDMNNSDGTRSAVVDIDSGAVLESPVREDLVLTATGSALYQVKHSVPKKRVLRHTFRSTLDLVNFQEEFVVDAPLSGVASPGGRCLVTDRHVVVGDPMDSASVYVFAR